MFEFKSGATVFHDHLGKEHQKPADRLIGWRPSAYALIKVGDLVLMVEPECAPGVWTLPGGGIEPHESLLDGLRRECSEELGFGVAIEPQTPLYLGEHGFYFKWTDEYLHSLVMVFAGRVTPDILDGRVLVPPDPGEILRIAWVHLRELDGRNCHHVIWPCIARLSHR